MNQFLRKIKDSMVRGKARKDSLLNLNLFLVIHIVVGFIYLLAFRYVLSNGQPLPANHWNQLKMLGAGYLIDLSIWFALSLLFLSRRFRVVALILGFIFSIFSFANLAVSQYFKAGITNFRFAFDYLSEIAPLAKTGEDLMPFSLIFIFALLPLSYWLVLFLIAKKKNFKANRTQAVVIILLTLTSIIWGRNIMKDASNILENNAFTRMVYNEYKVYKLMNKYSLLEETVKSSQRIYPDKKHFEKLGYNFTRKDFPLYKIPKVAVRKPSSKPNIVIIILESVAAKDTGFRKYNKIPGKNVTPFLTQLMLRSTVVKRFYSNADYTAGAEVAIFCSIHDSLRYTTGADSILRNRTHLRMHCLPQILKDLGYATMFFHSYTARFDNKDIFFPLNGMSEVIDKDYPVYKGLKQTYWGIKDIEMFKYGVKHLSKKKKPFLAAFLTVNNHPPFILHNPKEHIDFHETGSYGDYLNTVHQTDIAIAEFFKRAKREPWYHNTIFIITSDNGIILHSENLQPEPKWSMRFKMWHTVPFILFSPNTNYNLAKKVLDLPAASHIDITPTILDLLHLNIANSFAGESLFSKNRRGYTFIYDWFSKYYRLSWPQLYHYWDKAVFDLRNDNLAVNVQNQSHNMKWIQTTRNFFNLLIFRDNIWPVIGVEK